MNTKDYLLFLFEDICQKKIFIQCISFEDLHINIGNISSPTLLFFDILFCTTIIYEDTAFGFRLGGLKLFPTLVPKTCLKDHRKQKIYILVRQNFIRFIIARIRILKISSVK